MIKYHLACLLLLHISFHPSIVYNSLSIQVCGGGCLFQGRGWSDCGLDAGDKLDKSPISHRATRRHTEQTTMHTYSHSLDSLESLTVRGTVGWSRGIWREPTSGQKKHATSTLLIFYQPTIKYLHSIFFSRRVFDCASLSYTCKLLMI